MKLANLALLMVICATTVSVCLSLKLDPYRFRSTTSRAKAEVTVHAVDQTNLLYYTTAGEAKTQADEIVVGSTALAQAFAQSTGTLYLCYRTPSVHAALHFLFDQSVRINDKPVHYLRIHQTAIGQSKTTPRFFRITVMAGNIKDEFMKVNLGKTTLGAVWTARQLDGLYTYNAKYNCATAVAWTLHNLRMYNDAIAKSLMCMLSKSQMVIDKVNDFDLNEAKKALSALTAQNAIAGFNTVGCLNDE